MLSVLWTVLLVLFAALISVWITFTATRLDRLHARVDAASSALDAQLVRRAAALQHVTDNAGDAMSDATRMRLASAAHGALESDGTDKEAAENAVGRAVNDLADVAGRLPPAASEMLPDVADSATRVVIARRFYNDAVRDTRALRARRMPRLLRLAGHRENPQFFDIDDSTRWE